MDKIEIMNDITLMLFDADTLTLCAVRNALKAILSANDDEKIKRTDNSKN